MVIKGEMSENYKIKANMYIEPNLLLRKGNYLKNKNKAYAK